MGVIGLGFLVNFLSNAYIIFFTSLDDIIIALSQLKYVLGISIESSIVFLILLETVQKLTEINWLAFAIGGGSILLLLFLKKYARKIPGPLAAVVGSILVVYFLNLHVYGISNVGADRKSVL